MADYNLGRATGEVSIGYDGRGLRAAQADMASTAAEAAVLDASMGRVNKQFDENRKSTTLSAESIVRHRGQVENLQRTYQRYHDEHERGARRVAEAEEKLRRAVQSGLDDDKVATRLIRDVVRAREDEHRLLTRSEQAYSRYHTRLAAVSQEVERFNKAHINATAGMRGMANEAEKLGSALERMSTMLSTIARTVGTAGLMGMFGLASGGQLASLGAGGLNIIVGALDVIQQLSGAVALMPALMSAAAVSVGTLAIAFHGVGQAISSMGDPMKFMEAIRDMGPITRQAMLQLQSFTAAFRGARQVVQESFFAQIVRDIQPLVQTWLPLLMNAGRQVATQLGGMLHQAFSVLQDPAIQRGFQGFIQNMTVGMQAARGAIRPFIEAWTTLSVVGSQTFQRLGLALTDVVSKFNAWVQRSAESGKLIEWINRALDGFTKLGHVVQNIGLALNNVFNIAHGSGGGLLDTLVKLTAEFKTWTESVKGQNALTNFFELLKIAGATTAPILHLLGQAITVLGGTLTRLGIAIGPGLTSFMTSFTNALTSLQPAILAIAPSLNQFLTVLGQVLLQVVQQLGPQLPKLFEGLASALIALAPILPVVATALGKILDHLTPGEVQGIFLAVVALKGLSVAFAGVLAVMSINPIVLAIGAIAALAAGVFYAYNHFKGFHDLVNNIWPALQSFASWIKNTFVNAWHSVGDAVKTAIQGVKGAKTELEQALVEAVNGIGNFFSSKWNEFYNWGHNLVAKIVEGMADMLGPVGRIAIQIVEAIKDPIPQSRAKTGPFAQASPEEMGAKLAGDFAGGIASGSTGVGAASLSLVTGAAGGGAGGTSIGAPGGSANRSFETGKSGFDQAVTFLTKDLSAWSSIVEGAFGLFKDISQIFIDTVRVTANLWNRGDNPITQPGGLMGPPAGAQQQHVPGVPDVPIKGVAPDDYGKRLATRGEGGGWNQQQVGGVPSKPLVGPGPWKTTQPAQGAPAPLPPVSGTSGTGKFAIGPSGAPPANPPASTTGGAAPAGLPNYTGQDAELVGELKKHGFTDSQIVGLVALNSVETGNWSHPESIMGFTNEQTGPGIAAHVAGFKGMWDNRQSGGAVPAAGHPDSGVDASGNVTDPTKYANWLLKLEGYSATSDWQGNQYAPGQFMAASTYASKVSGAYAGQPTPPPTQGGLPGGPVTGQLRPGVLQGGPEQGLKPAATNVAGIIEKLFPQVKTIGGVHDDSLSYHPSGHALDIMLPGDPQSPENIALGNQINDFLRANAEQLGISDTIFRSQYYATGQPPEPYHAKSDDPNQRHETHIHTTFEGPGGGGGAEPSQFETDITKLKNLPPSFQPPTPPATAVSGIQVPGLPRGPGGITGGGIHLPSDAATYAIGGAAAAVGGYGAYKATGAGMRAAFAFSNIPSNLRTAWLRYNYNRLDAKEKADVLKSLSPQERALIGKNPEIAFGPEGVKDPSVRGLIVDLGGDPNLVDVYHVTDEAGARGIMDRGFQGGQAYFNTDPRNARASLGIYGDRVIAGQVPQNALENIGAAVRANPSDLQGVDWRQLTPAQLEDLSATNTFRTPAIGVPPANQSVSTAGADPANVTGDVGRAAGPGGLRRGLGIAGRTAGPAASLANAGLIAYGAVAGSVDAVERRNLAANRAAAQDGTVLGIPALGPSFPNPVLQPVVRPLTPTDRVAQNPPVISPELGGFPGAQRERRGLPPIGASTPVHVTNTEQMPGGVQSPAVQRAVTPTSAEKPLGAPKPGEPGFVGPVAVQPSDQGPQPGAQAERRGEAPKLGAAATQDVVQGQIGTDTGQNKSAAKTPMDQFTTTLGSVSSIAGDAFKIFNDIIRNIGAAANMTDLLVRGFANTENVMFYIDEMQTFITTAADIAKLVGDVGGMVGGASGGADFGAGAALQAIAGIVSSALEATNAAIDLSQQVYHEVTKYAGFIIGSFLGGAGTGPLGGNVRMLLNTSTNELYTYSEDNPQNKNTFQVPAWQRSYAQTPPPVTQQSQVNIYAGPGQKPRDMMNETMWLVGTGNPAVASVSGAN